MRSLRTSTREQSLLTATKEKPDQQRRPTFIDYVKAFDCVEHNNKSLWKILKEMGIPDHLHCLLRNLYAVKKLPWYKASLVTQLVKNPPARQATQVQSLGQEYLLEKG